MEVRGEADLEDDHEMQVEGSKTTVYVLHPNCNVESITGVSEQETQVVEQ